MEWEFLDIFLCGLFLEPAVGTSSLLHLYSSGGVCVRETDTKKEDRQGRIESKRQKIGRKEVHRGEDTDRRH